jgi:hypothetical protein
MTEDTDERPLNISAAVLGWILPGLGHMRAGEAARGRLILLGIGGLFLLGLLVGGVDCVDRHETGLWFVAQAGAGGPAFVADLLNTMLLKSGRVGELLPLTTPTGTTQVSSFKGAGPASEVGTLLCGLAGMMNVVMVLDVLHRHPRAARGAA